jgi:hypothetical protein
MNRGALRSLAFVVAAVTGVALAAAPTTTELKLRCASGKRSR